MKVLWSPINWKIVENYFKGKKKASLLIKNKDQW